MKINPVIFFLLLFFGLATPAWALADFDLKEPTLAFPEGFPEPARTNIMAHLQRADCKFVGGGFINSFTNLKYSGDTRALNLFMAGLVQCHGVVLSVRLHTDRTNDSCDWFVAHEASNPYQLTVHVNLKNTQIKVDDLVIPESKGPPVSTAPK